METPDDLLHQENDTKEFVTTFNNKNSNFESKTCSNCDTDLLSRCVFCETCSLHICCYCFAQGVEFGQHKSDHSYRILRTDFTLFDSSGWTAAEELRLLDSIEKYGNWNLVGLEFPQRTINEIKEHYEYFYLDSNGSKAMPTFEKDNLSAVYPDPVIPYRFKLTDCEEPPRNAPNTIGYQSLAGYNAARGDFECEFDKDAETVLSSVELWEIDDPQCELLTKLQCAIMESYNRRLRERRRWKNIMGIHGLISLRKVNAWLQRYDVTITKPVCDRLVRFMQFYQPMQFDMLMEGLHRAGELKIHIHRLIEFRKNGITSMEEAKLYLKLQKQREDHHKQLRMFRSLPQFDLRTNRSFIIPPLKVSRRRSNFVPIEIIGMPGYEKLTDNERNLCKAIRLVPATYLELKNLLVADNQKTGHVKLQTARKLLKIDVNKTRKLYDFLVEQGYISKGPC